MREIPTRIGIIGGTGLASLLDKFEHCSDFTFNTPWGKPSAPISLLKHSLSIDTVDKQATEIAFLPRHGTGHQLAPHEVPYRANIAALRCMGVRTIIAFSAVGSLQEDIRPRDFVVPDQIIDRTKGIRGSTFFEDGIVGHVGFADPFDPELGKIIRQCGHSMKGEGLRVHDQGTIICIEGPQFSTRAESNLYRSWGGSVINMSVLPEAKLAREAELAYQMICMSTDYDCWHSTAGDVSVDMVMGHMKANGVNAGRFVNVILAELMKEEHQEVILAMHLRKQSQLAGSVTKAEARGEMAKKKLGWLFGGRYFQDAPPDQASAGTQANDKP